MAIIAITGRKGGIGKSTITANLAAELVALGRSVAVLDTDPQKSLMAWAELGEGLLRELVEAVDTTHPRQFVARVEAASKRAERMLIDTPPGFADAALLAALQADLVLLPAGPSPLDIMAARDALALAREARKERALRANGKLECEVCGFDFHDAYGERGKGFIECHHVRPLESLPGSAKRGWKTSPCSVPIATA